MSDDAARLFAGKFKTFEEATREELIDHIQRWEAISKELTGLVGKLQTENAAMREIVQAVADLAPLHPHGFYDLEGACPFCNEMWGEHKNDCLVLKAPTLLAGEG